jgi:hypothetical protein
VRTLIARACATTVMLLLLAPNGLAATVKLKDGRVVEGEIQGRVVQREIKASVRNGATYEITNGRDVVAIDEQGVHFAPVSELLMGTTTEQRRPLDDIEVIQLLLDPPAGLFPRTKGGANVLRFGPARRKEGDVTSTTPLLGTIRGDPGKRSLLPALEMVTREGPVTIQITEIMPFAPTQK